MKSFLSHIHILSHPVLLIMLFVCLLIMLSFAYLFPAGKQAHIEHRHLTSWEEDEPIQY